MKGMYVNAMTQGEERERERDPFNIPFTFAFFQMKGIYVNAISKSSHNFNNKISIVVVKEMLLLVIYLKYFKQDKISCSFPPVCKKLHNLRILLKKTIKKNCSTFAFDLLLSEWVDWTAVGEEEAVKHRENVREK